MPLSVMVPIGIMLLKTKNDLHNAASCPPAVSGQPNHAISTRAQGLVTWKAIGLTRSQRRV